MDASCTLSGPRVRRAWPLLLAALSALACDRGGREKDVVARWRNGTVSLADLQQEANRLPPALRARVDEAGRRELVQAIVDRRLLAEEARRRGLHEDPEIRRQVQELEERLSIQKLLAAEEGKSIEPTEQELRAYFDAHAAELTQPERVRVERVLAAVTPGAPEAERARARARAEGFAARLRKGEPMSRVAADGDGPERARGGDLGLLARGESADVALVEAAFALDASRPVSDPIATQDGFAVVRLVERRPGRPASFDEARQDVRNRLLPARKRKAFDDLLSRLRREADVELRLATRAP